MGLKMEMYVDVSMPNIGINECFVEMFLRFFYAYVYLSYAHRHFYGIHNMYDMYFIFLFKIVRGSTLIHKPLEYVFKFMPYAMCHICVNVNKIM